MNNNNLYDFILTNKFVFLFILITLVILLLFDSRFPWKNKMLILGGSLVYLLFIFFVFYYDRVNSHIFLKDIFWYTLVLNGSFIFHTLYLNWIFRFCWKRRWETTAFFVSRLSWFLSLCGLKTLISYLRYNLTLNQPFLVKYFSLRCLFFVFDIPLILLEYFINFFIKIFINYNKLLMGKSETNFRWRNFINSMFGRSHDRSELLMIVNVTIFFLITFLSSWLILGISRLYLVWIYFFLEDIIKLFLIFRNNLEKHLLINPSLSQQVLLLYHRSSIFYGKFLLVNFFRDFYYNFNTYIIRFQEFFIKDNLNICYYTNFSYLLDDFLIYSRYNYIFKEHPYRSLFKSSKLNIFKNYRWLDLVDLLLSLDLDINDSQRYKSDVILDYVILYNLDKQESDYILDKYLGKSIF